MVICAESFAAKLKEEDIKFAVQELPNDRVCISIPFNGIMTNVFFDADDDGSRPAFRTMLEHCPDDRVADLLVVCNAMNNEYRWLKFCIDSDNDIMLEDDAIVTPENAGSECVELIYRTASIVKDVKPTFMRAIYG